MNEVENNIPVENTEVEDGFDEVSNEILGELSNENSEDFDFNSEEPKESETKDGDETNVEDEGEAKEEGIDFKPFLEYLSKNTKYNKENVNVESIEEVISNFQKGLNYEKLQNKIDSLENGKALKYISSKAQELGVSVDEYMEQVEEYEREQQKERENQKLQEMIDNGVPEDIAKEVIATSELRKQLQEEKNQLERQRKEQEEKANKEKEYDDFIKEFPNVKAEDIPKEVFENSNAKNQTLLQSYKDYLYENLKKELEQYKKNEENSNKVVGSTQGYGSKDSQVATDLFLEGFDS